MRRVSREIEVEILRLSTVEKWPVGTIATQLGLHHGVIRRVLEQAGMPPPRDQPRASKVDPFVPFMRETLEKYPRLRASRLYVMAKERGYTGSEGHLRRKVRELRPRPKAEAYMRLSMLAGEEAQVDWGHFGKVQVGRAQRTLLGFVMTLSYSRRVFLRFFFDAKMASFLRGHVDAFAFFGGVPRRLLYDNLKSAVAERQGDAVRFNSRLLELAAHYGVAVRAAAPARGNEKGRVERSIRYVRDSFFAAREFTGLEQLNNEARSWSTQIADQRPWPQQRDKKVIEAFADEAASLRKLPDNPFEAQARVDAKVGRTPYVRFDLNDYSVPHTLVRRSVEVLATVERVRVLDGVDVVADHARSYDKGQQIEDPTHLAELVEEKRRARRQSGMGRLEHGAPASSDMLRAAAERGDNLGSLVSQLLILLDTFGPNELEAAIAECNARGVVHAPSVRQVLEQRNHAAGRPMPLPVVLTDERLRDYVVRPHALASYDRNDDEDEENSER